MIAISLWQPWATLLVRGLKRYETRSWKPGDPVLESWIAIHAAKQKYRDGNYPQAFRAQLLYDEIDPHRLPMGAIVGFARFDLFESIDNLAVDELSDREQLYGNYTVGEGRWAWHTADHIEIEPIEYQGHQGFFNLRGGHTILGDALTKRNHKEALRA